MNKEYYLFIDNFSTSIHLAKALLHKNTYLTGTIRRTRKIIPNEAKFAQVVNQNISEVAKYLCALTETKKSKNNPVILISTGNMTDTKKKGNVEHVKEKPSIIHNYNRFMREVDECDKILYTYLDEKRTLKYGS